MANLRTAVRLAAAMGSAALLACAHPKLDAWPLAFVGLAGLFALWSRSGLREAAASGALAGLVYFAIVCSWIGDTAGPLLGPFAFILDVGPALVELPAFVATALVTAALARRADPLVAAVGSAAAFAFFEWLRGIGVLGGPLGQLGMPFVETRLAAIAAFGGPFGITFVVALVAAVAVFVPRTLPVPRRTAIGGAGIVALVAVVVVAANAAWPALRDPSKPLTVVAGVQGNIKQTIKWKTDTLAPTVARYVRMTEALAPAHPAVVLWPETVITTDLGVPAAEPLRQRFQALARRMHTTLIVGAQWTMPAGEYYDALAFIAPNGAFEKIYEKRQLVPFAEKLPAPWLRGLPFTDLAGDYSLGTEPTVVDPAGLGLAPSICWETGFGDLIHDQLANGAKVLLVATDDAWFGVTAGPYQQAQIAQMRAIESGRWVLRAAATGVSGIIDPTGRYREKTALDTQTSVIGRVGPPRPTVYAALGPTPVALALGLLVLGAFAFPQRSVAR